MPFGEHKEDVLVLGGRLTPTCEPQSKPLVSPLIDPIVVPFIILYITPFKEFRLWLM